MRIAIHVTPRSGRDEIAGWRGGELAVRVSAPAEGGKANAAACAMVASALGVPKGSVRVARGQASRHKQLDVDGAGPAEVEAAFGRPPEAIF